MVKVNVYEGHPVPMENGFKQAEDEIRKVLRKKLEDCRTEMKRDGRQHQKWRGGANNPMKGVLPGHVISMALTHGPCSRHAWSSPHSHSLGHRDKGCFSGS